MWALLLSALIPALSFAQSERFETDRPDKTRPVQTVDQNHFIFEAGFASKPLVFEPLARYGLTNSSEVQLTPHTAGFQYNIIGNKGEDFGVSVTVYTSFEYLEGGIAIPLSFSLPMNWEGSFTIEASNIEDSTYSVALSIGHQLYFEDLMGFVEIFHEENDIDETTLDLSLQYELNPRTMIDAGVFIGLNPDVDDQYFIGGSFYY
jgi:hypothetical protein